MSDDKPKPKPLPPKSRKERLKQHLRRIRLAKAIKIKF